MSAPRTVDRYALHRELASGGMGAVRLGRLHGEAGFGRVVAIKTLHAHLAKDPDVVAMFLAEAKLVSRIRHPNVVPTLDVVAGEGELLLVMEYVHGESLAALIRRANALSAPPPPAVVSAIVTDALEGLFAAHQATNSRGVPLKIVHRDVSPQNLMVGVDGLTRVLDFGVARAVERTRSTGDASLKGKVAYISPERLSTAPFDHRADLWSMGVVLWELVTREKMFPVAESPAATMVSILRDELQMPGELGHDATFDEVIRRALQRDPKKRFESARQMSQALEKLVAPAPARDVGRWVRKVAQEALAERQQWVEEVENGGDLAPQFVSGTRVTPSVTPPPVAAPPSSPSAEPSVAFASPADGTTGTRGAGRRVWPAVVLLAATVAASFGVTYFVRYRQAHR
ncbi:MAG: serine/threonine protein kinase, partial [Polyangiaceae bacterium]|nr:serine/threonine protein kinase [Polyangiaceae bacterium]